MAGGSSGVNTKQAERRTLRFADVGELLAELDRLEAANAAGTLRSTGNWSAGQNLEHIARFWKAPIDGFPENLRPPFLFKLIIQLLFKKKALAGDTAPAGMKPPKEVTDVFEPSDAVSFEDGLAHLRRQIARTEAGERFTVPSPLFGELSHEQWMKIQLGHCQLHLSFLHMQ